MRHWPFGARVAICTITLCLATPVAADDCPSGKSSFFIERDRYSKTEVVYSSGPIFQTILYYREKKLAETTLYEGLFELDRLDRGQRYILKPKANLAKFFPLKVGQKIDVGFDIQQGRATGASRVKLNVIGSGSIIIGSCKYDILKIDRDETGARLFQNVDYYAPALRMVVAKEHKERDGRSTVIKFERIYAAASR
jgi:hypothetical protein